LFVSIAALFSIIQKAFDFTPSHWLKRFLIFMVAGVLLTVGLWDQNFKRAVIKNDAWKQEYLSDQDFVIKLEEALPIGATIYQTPYFEFPETPPTNQLNDYDLFRGYLHSKNLKWSYGAIKGRETANLFKTINQMPLTEQIKHIRALGFQGIYIDRRGYTDRGANLENGLSKILGNGPLVSENGNLSFFRLDPNPSGQPDSVQNQGGLGGN
ncbi:MAG: sugar translocase, partial [Desulfomonilaceae bacterium]